MENFFKNRIDAGNHLAMKLLKYKDSDSVVVGLPRGGVIVASEVARALNLPLDIVIVRKITHKGNPEYAIGAVSEDSKVFLGHEAQLLMGQDWLNIEIQSEIAEAKRRRQEYTHNEQKQDWSGKTIIIVDDGVATGYSLMVAIESVKKSNPSKIIVAVPVAPQETIDKLQKILDTVVVALKPQFFLGSVGAYYDSFEQVSDEEVKDTLKTEVRQVLRR